MNTRTTIVLAIVLAVLGLAYAWRPAQQESPSSTGTLPTARDSQAAKPVIDPPLGNITKIECHRQGVKPSWVFQRSQAEGSAADWRLTSPIEAKAVRWEVDRIARQLTGLKYEIVYRAGADDALSADQAGLNPPRATVALTDEKGTTATLEIGGPQSASTSYVRLAGRDDIYVANTSLGRLIKKRAIDYRDQQLWEFDTSKVTKVEITDRSDVAHPAEYLFVKHGSGWQMEKPAVAKATGKVSEMLTSMSRLRMANWVDDQPNRLAGYGLAPAALTVRATVVEEVELPPSGDTSEKTAEGSDTDKDDETVKPVKTQTREKTFLLNLSDQSPIGQDARVYANVGDESAVGAVMKTTAEKFKPVVNQWRDMRITDADVSRATHIELSTEHGSATLVQRDGGWWFETDDKKADDEATAGLLKAVASLTAVAFVDQPDNNSAEVGFTHPQAKITLALPGSATPERITIGGFTNAQSKRLVYVQRNAQTSIGKVRVEDIAKLMRGSMAYLDRSVVRLASAKITGISLSTDNPYTQSRRSFTFGRTGDTWHMTKPVEANLQQNKMTDLVHALADLSAKAVVGSADELSAFGLNTPAIEATISYQADDDTTKTIALAFAAHEGKAYAKRADRDAIYQVTAALLKQLSGEFRTETVLTFDEAKVTSFTISTGGVAHRFNRQEDQSWTYGPEPDLPLDKAKVDALLLRLKDLKTTRYAVYGANDLAKFGLDTPAHRATVTMADGQSLTLLVSSQATHGTADRGVFARLDGFNDVFVLPPDTPTRLQVNLAELEVSR